MTRKADAQNDSPRRRIRQIELQFKSHNRSVSGRIRGSVHFFPTKGGTAGMKRCKTHVVRVCLFLLAAAPAFCQRSTFGIDVGQTSDKFGSLNKVNGLEADIEGQV